MTDGMRPIRIVASGGSVPRGTTESVSGDMICRQSRIRFKTGDVPCTSLAPVLAGYSVPDGSGAEVESPNGYRARVSVEWPWANPRTVRCRWWFGDPETFVSAGAGTWAPNAVHPHEFGMAYFPANTEFYVRVTEFIQNGEYFTDGRYPVTGIGEVLKYCDGNLENVDGWDTDFKEDGSFSFPSWVDDPNTPGMAPVVAVIGRTVGEACSCLIIGDSVAQGMWDNQDGWAGRGGYLQRGLDTEGVAWSNLARSGNRATTTSGDMSRRLELAGFATHVICNLGSNDILNGETTNDTRDALRVIWQALSDRGLYATQSNMLLFTTSTDAWLTAGNQTVETSFGDWGTSGGRDALNTAISGNVSSNGLDAALDIKTTMEDSGHANKWKSDGVTANKYTVDGLHPAADGHIAGGSPVATAASGWTAS